MIRKIIKINADLCNGCGACAAACHEGAIEMIDGKATLTREDYCDGLGDCLPACPMDAIKFEEREAPAYDEAAVLAAKQQKEKAALNVDCPSQLSHWPVKIKLAPLTAPYFNEADLLIAADCTAYAYGNIHNDFIRNHVTLIGCPKLDNVDYADKLKPIIAANNIKTITLLRMEVPCCGGMENALKRALQASGKNIELKVVTVTTDGRLL